MKKPVFWAFILVSFVLLSCEQKPKEQPKTETQAPAPLEQKPKEEIRVESKTQAPTRDMLAFAQQKGCLACHDINAKKVGPAFREVAKKHAGEKDAEVHVAERIIKGGVGEWGNVPMPPQNVTEQEAKELAKWVLSLK